MVRFAPNTHTTINAYNTMAIFSTLRAEMAASLGRTSLSYFDSLNLTYFASEYAERLAPHMNDLSAVGCDFLYGRARVNYLRNHTWADYGQAAAHLGTENMEALCCSAGAVNIGIYGNKLVLKHAWQVGVVRAAFMRLYIRL
jgi:hypothetical protein